MSQPAHGLTGQQCVGNESSRFLFDCNPKPLLIWDAETHHFLAANEAAMRHYGYSEDEFQAMKAEFIRVSEDLNPLSELLRKLPTDVTQSSVCRLQRKDGTPIDVEIGTQQIDWAGKPAYLVGTHGINEIEHTERALRESEERVGLILASAAEAIFGCDPVGTCIFCNDAAARALGYDDPAELVGKNMHATEHHTRADGRPYPLEECPIYLGFREGHGVYRDDEVFWRKDGSSFPVEYWSHITVQDGKSLCVVGFMDITVRKQTEKALHESERWNRTLLEINNAIITNLTREALFQSVCEALHRVIDFDRSAMTLYDPVTDRLRFVAFTGNAPFSLGHELKRTESAAGWVFDHQRPIVRGDLQKEQQYPSEQRMIIDGMRSHCLAPLMVRGRCIGTLNIASKLKFQYSARHAQLLQEVATQIALAVENMRSYEEIAELKVRLEKENVYLQEEIRTEHNFEEIVGNSPSLMVVLNNVEQVAPTDSTVLIQGETGTGKELIARAIHDRSNRKHRALVKVNCSAISAGLVESELFGHIKGAFTGALDKRMGRFELADGGTIFLDEVGELPLETQVKLLRVLQEREFEPVGSSRPLRVDVRVIAATNRNLQEAIQAGRFRSDLFYRLNVFPLEVPPLRERRSDIPKLAKFFLWNYSRRLGKKIDGISQDSMDRILSYSWPGNVRELQNVIERAVVLSRGQILELQHELTPDLVTENTHRRAADSPKEAAAASAPGSQFPTLKEIEQAHILAALKLSSGVIEGPNGAAKILNLHPNTLRHRMGKFGIKRSGHHAS